MTPAARAQAAIEVLDVWLSGSGGLDKILTAWGRTHRFAGSKDRAGIADLAYDALRRKRSAAWVAGTMSPTGRDLIRGALLLDGGSTADLFSGERYAPAVLTDAEKLTRPLVAAPRPVRLDLPDWIDGMLGDVSEAELQPLRHRAALDLRVNAIKADIPKAQAALAEEGIQTETVPLADGALRVTEGARQVHRARAYLDGWVEVQDAASQAAAAMARVRPGETVLDLCAGGGGKTLALASAMQNKGQLLAYDRARQRLRDLPARAKRAGARVDIVDHDDLPAIQSRCDLVFVDAPCSGSGAWRRNPDAKWRFRPADLVDLKTIQTALLAKAAAMTAPTGRVLYATCSILPDENQRQIDRFLVEHPDWRQITAQHFTLGDGADGFFATLLSRNDA